MKENLEEKNVLAVSQHETPKRALIEELIEKRRAREREMIKEMGKKGKKKKHKAEVTEYDSLFENYPVEVIGGFNPVAYRRERYCRGDIVPENFKLNLYSESGFFFGKKCELNEYIGKPASEDGHILIAGVPGSGKTMGVVIPTMMTWRGSQIILDVKGDLYGYWLDLNRYTGKKILHFSPDSPAGCGCQYDPFLLLRQGGEKELAGNVRDLASALMPILPSVKEPIWIQSAQNFLAGALFYFYRQGISFIEAMEEIQSSSIQDILDKIMKSEDPVATIFLSKLAEVNGNVLVNIGLELSNLASLITDESILEMLMIKKGRSILDWTELNTSKKPVDIILTIPEEKLERWRPMLLLMLNQMIRTLEKRQQRTYRAEELPPVLVMLDEFPRIGKISAITNGLATLRSRGVTFALCVQSLSSLGDVYGNQTARVILDTCAYKAVLGVADVTSQKYFSELIGTTFIARQGFSVNHSPTNGNVLAYGRSIAEHREPIVYPDELLMLNDVVLITPYGFCRVNKIPYYRNQKWFHKQQLIGTPEYEKENPWGYSYA